MENTLGDIFDVKIVQPDPRAGDLLVAVPFLGDSCFRRSVVCIIEHSADGGTMGLVTNRLSGYTLDELIENVETSEDVPVFVGGPVHNDRLYYLHTLGNLFPDSIEVAPGLFVGGDFDAVKSYISSGGPVEGRVRFFVGCSGWGRGQLRRELDNHDWAVTKLGCVDDIMLGREDAAWRAQVAMLGERYRLWLNCPDNAWLN